MGMSAGGNDGEVGVLLGRDRLEAVLDAPDRAEEADERSHRSHRGEERQPLVHGLGLAGDGAQGDSVSAAGSEDLDTGVNQDPAQITMVVSS